MFRCIVAFIIALLLPMPAYAGSFIPYKSLEDIFKSDCSSKLIQDENYLDGSYLYIDNYYNKIINNDDAYYFYRLNCPACKLHILFA